MTRGSVRSLEIRTISLALVLGSVHSFAGCPRAGVEIDSANGSASEHRASSRGDVERDSRPPAEPLGPDLDVQPRIAETLFIDCAQIPLVTGQDGRIAGEGAGLPRHAVPRILITLLDQAQSDYLNWSISVTDDPLAVQQLSWLPHPENGIEGGRYLTWTVDGTPLHRGDIDDEARNAAIAEWLGAVAPESASTTNNRHGAHTDWTVDWRSETAHHTIRVRFRHPYTGVGPTMRIAYSCGSTPSGPLSLEAANDSGLGLLPPQVPPLVTGMLRGRPLLGVSVLQTGASVTWTMRTLSVTTEWVQSFDDALREGGAEHQGRHAYNHGNGLAYGESYRGPSDAAFHYYAHTGIEPDQTTMAFWLTSTIRRFQQPSSQGANVPGDQGEAR